MGARGVFAACVAAVVLANCSGPRAPLNPPQLVSDSETDMSLQLFMQATILLAKYYGYTTLSYSTVRERSAAAGYNTIPFMAPVTVPAVPRLTSFAIDQVEAEKFRDLVDNKNKGIGYKGLVAYYIRTGLRASQLICRNYLLGLAEKNDYLQFLKKEFGVFNTLADGVLLAVSANGTLLHAFALGRDAINGGIDAYEQYRFLSVDREAARVLVEVAQQRYAAYFMAQLDRAGGLRNRDQTAALPEFFTFSDALNAVSTIESQCTRTGIQSLITRAVNNTPSNLDVDRETGQVMFRSNGGQIGTGDKPASGEGKGPETPAGNKPPGGDGSVKPPVVPVEDFPG